MIATTPKIIIAGGGITGLSLALMLERIGIDYFLLEANDEIHPQVGAGIAFTGNGFRILDQLGVYEDILKKAPVHLNTMIGLGPQGNTLFKWGGITNEMLYRLGYPFIGLERQMVLEVLYNHLKDKSKVLTGKKITSVICSQEKVEVMTKDGKLYAGDILVGADGVYSKVRREMWRIAKERDSEWATEEEQNPVSAPYYCMFGISDMKGKVPAGATCNGFGENKSINVISGGRGRVFWFFNKPFGQRLYGEDIPRFTEEDTERFVRQHWNDIVFPGVKFGELYENRVKTILTPLHSHVFKKWSMERIIILGDAAHKLLPISGQGAAQAIESTAVFVNELHRQMRASSTPLSPDMIHSVLSTTQSLRHERVASFIASSEAEMRLLCMPNWIYKFICLKIMPRLGSELILQAFINTSRTGTRLEMLPVPQRDTGILGFTDEFMLETKAPIEKRDLGMGVVGVLTACLIFRALMAVGNMLRLPDTPSGDSAWLIDSRLFSPTVMSNGIYDINAVDAAKSLPLFLIGDAYISAMMAAPLTVLLAEGYRASNALSVAQWPTVWSVLAQIFGLQWAIPLYFIAQVYMSARANPDADRFALLHRKVSGSASIVIFPVVGLCYLLPHILNLFNLLTSAPSILLLVCCSPAFITALCFYLSTTPSLALPEPAAKKDRARKGSGEESEFLEIGYAVIAVALALVHTMAMKPFFAFKDTALLRASLSAVPLVTAMFLWLLYNVSETVTRKEMLNNGARKNDGAPQWRTFLALPIMILAAFGVVGPGATILACWYWREGVLRRAASKEAERRGNRVK